MADTEFFEWASDLEDADGVLTKLQPPVDIQVTGTTKNEPIARVWLNYMFNRIFLSIESQVGDVIQTTLTLTTDEDFARYGGLAANWAFGGTLTGTGGAASVIRIYERTS